MKIRQDQMETLSLAIRNDFHRNLLEFLRKELPKETAEFNDAALYKRIEESEERAAVYEIQSQAGIAQFVCLTFAAGPEFDTIPEVHAYLTTSETQLTPEERLNVLVDELADEEGK